MNQDRDTAIRLYISMGLLYKDIVRVLAIEHGIFVSLRHLKRLVRQQGLSRRRNYSDIGEVVEFVQAQLQTSGKLHGYRWMYEKCLAHRLWCKKEDIRLILSVLDPEGNDQRRKRRLLRRAYSSRGPNYLWHVDSYDKLKRYGVCINGCVDGYSRKVVWLSAYHTSSDPKLIGGYFIQAVESLGGCPRIVRGDLGTENGHVKDMQRFLRLYDDDAMAGDKSYLEGPSTANQRIEYWWSFLRRECTDYWICLFRDMLDAGHFSGNFLDVNLVRFCFMHLIQDDLDDVVTTWNRHLIRPSTNARSPSGRPNVMYYLPQLYGTRDYTTQVPAQQIDMCREECSFRGMIPCDEDVYDMCCLLMNDNGYRFPNDADSARDLFIDLKRLINQYLV